MGGRVYKIESERCRQKQQAKHEMVYGTRGQRGEKSKKKKEAGRKKCQKRRGKQMKEQRKTCRLVDTALRTAERSSSQQSVVIG